MANERTRRRAVLATAAAVAVFLAAAPPRALADAKEGGVSGKVVDAAGRANEGVKVTVQRGDAVLGTTYTDSDGKFAVEHVPAGGGYTVFAVRAVRGLSMSGQKDGVTVKAGKATNVGSIAIQIGGAG